MYNSQVIRYADLFRCTTTTAFCLHRRFQWVVNSASLMGLRAAIAFEALAHGSSAMDTVVSITGAHAGAEQRSK
jgi:hypothetical protein